MPKIIYVQRNGVRKEAEAAVGTSLMQAAILNGVDGIIGECGGSAMCATCHIYVDPEFAAAVPPLSQIEDDLLDSTAAERQPNSRLGCQISIAASLDGIVVHVPERQ
jgi:ferredoxin, 2Fe-2S